MSKNQIAVIAFVLENAPSAPVHRRISIYRGLADLCGDAEESSALTALANELDATEAHASQFYFNFAKRNAA